ncbi:hypothetical protein I7I48_08282 [Histoplasma ohiense]|nr:hypothetical protein I7I48_08282 [Histoplasma ohiense (nom. inval.)]
MAVLMWLLRLQDRHRRKFQQPAVAERENLIYHISLLLPPSRRQISLGIGYPRPLQASSTPFLDSCSSATATVYLQFTQPRTGVANQQSIIVTSGPLSPWYLEASHILF